MFLAVFIIVALIVLGGAIWALMDRDPELFFGGIGAAFLTLIAGVCLTGLIGLFCVLNDETGSGHEVKTELKALSVDSSMSGSFFLGIGGFGEDTKYYYIEETDKGMQMKSMDIDDNVYLKEEAGVTPHIVRDCGLNDMPDWLWYPFETPTDDKPDCYYPDTTFVVPPGSVTYEFKVETPGLND